jgi:hypothetical protein
MELKGGRVAVVSAGHTFAASLLDKYLLDLATPARDRLGTTIGAAEAPFGSDRNVPREAVLRAADIDVPSFTAASGSVQRSPTLARMGPELVPLQPATYGRVADAQALRHSPDRQTLVYQ